MSKVNKYANEVMTSEIGGKFALAPAGNHIAVCIGVVSLGTILKEYEGHEKMTKCLRLYFELTKTKNAENDDKPFIVSQEYTDSVHANAGLRKLLVGWFGDITDKELESFTLVNLIGCQGMCNVTVTKTQKGQDRNKIMGMSPIPDGIEMPELIGEPFLFNFNPPFKVEEFNNLEPWVQDIIKSSTEYKALDIPAAAAPAEDKPKATAGRGNRPF